MREAFDAQLRGLLESIMEMGGLAERMIGDALLALLNDDVEAMARVHEMEKRVNALHKAIDEKAVELTITQQPVARDVRLIFVASRCAADVERVGDQAVNIAGSAEHLLEIDPADRAEVPEELPQLAEAARTAFADGLAAVIMRNVAMAEQVLAKEPEIDALRDAVFKRLLYEMITRPEAASSALSLLLVSRNLERIGDHATNLAEEVVYVVRGKDIRHNRVE